MPIVLQDKDGRVGLVAQCDVCGKTVNAGESNILWTPNDKREHDGIVNAYRIACKVGCTAKVDALLCRQAWQSLGEGFFYLLNNTQYDHASAKRASEMKVRVFG